MTVQEAIEILRDTPIDIRSTREDDIHTLYATAQGMAIEALELQERQELIVGSYLLEEPSCSEKQINMAIGAITHMLHIGYYSEDMEDALYSAIKVLAEVERGGEVKQMTSEKTGIFDKNGKEICVGDVVHFRGCGLCAHGTVVKHDLYGYAIDDDRPKTKGRKYDLHNEGVYRIEGKRERSKSEE